MRDTLGRLLTAKPYLHPIFVVGAGRSGTSVLNRALGKHPLILPTMGEAILIPRLGGVVDYLEEVNSRDYRQSNLKAGKDIVYDSLRRLCFESAVGRDYGLTFILKLILKDLIQRRDASRLKSPFRWKNWCAKTFPNSEQYGGLMTLFPGMKTAYVIRSGPAVVQSRTRHPSFRHNTFSEHCHAWKDFVDKYRYLTQIESAIEVRQEDLVTRPGETLERVFKFVDIEYHETPASFVRSTLVEGPNNPAEVASDVEKEFRSRRPAYEDWSSEQRETFKRICSDAMDELGYALPPV